MGLPKGGVHGRQAPFIGPVTDVTEPAMVRAFGNPANRDAVAGIARFLAEPDEIRLKTHSSNRDAVFLREGRLLLKPLGRQAVKPSFVLDDRIGIADATVTVKRMTLPPSLLQSVEGMRLGDVVETGVPEVDAATVRIARQGGTTLGLYFCATTTRMPLAVMLGHAGICWPPID